MKKLLIFLIGGVFGFASTSAQQIQWTPDQIKQFSKEFTGNRGSDGRPYISDALLKRLKNTSIEEAWGYLKNKGFNNHRRSLTSQSNRIYNKQSNRYEQTDKHGKNP